MPHLTWQKSSFSGSGQNNCVEVAAAHDTLHLRESDDPTVALTAPSAALRALLAHLKSGAHRQA